MPKRLLFFLTAAFVFFALVLMFRSDFGGNILWAASREGNWLLPLIIVSSLVDSINPCAFSVLFLTIAFLFSIGKLRNKILLIGSAYVLGIFIVYILIGLGILRALHLFGMPNFMGKAAAVLLVILGAVSLANEYFPRFPIKLKIPSIAHKQIARLMEKGTVPATFALGFFVGLCEFPCTGGPYLTILGLLHDRVTYFSGFIYLLIYNTIFISPLVLILLIASDELLLKKVEGWKRRNLAQSRLISGIAMIAIGMVILFI